MFKNVQYFVTSDSICICMENALTERTPKRCIMHIAQKEPLHENGIVFLLSDFTAITSFEDINPFSGKKMKKGAIVLKPYLFPIEVVKKDKNCTIYNLA